MDTNTIYCENCIETMRKMSSNFVDLTVTSPPYDNLRNYNGYSFDFETIAKELYRVTKEGGVVVWIVGDATVKGSETGTSFKQALYFKEIGFNLHDTMIYMKDNPPPTGGDKRYYQAFEYCFVLSKGTPKTFNPIVEERRNKWNDKRTVRTRPVTRNKAGIFVEKQVIRRLDIVSDGTGNHGVSDMKGKIDGAKKAGYKVVGIYATVPTQDALTRANVRGQQTGRFVPPEVIVNTHAGVSKIFSTIAPMFDKVTLYETSGKLTLLASSEGGKPLVVHNTQLFATFEAKAFEMFRPTE